MQKSKLFIREHVQIMKLLYICNQQGNEWVISGSPCKITKTMNNKMSDSLVITREMSWSSVCRPCKHYVVNPWKTCENKQFSEMNSGDRQWVTHANIELLTYRKHVKNEVSAWN